MSLDFSSIMTVVETRTAAFAEAELGLIPRRVDRTLCDLGALSLRDVNALITVGPRTGLYVIFSYDQALIADMMRRYSPELEDDEADIIHDAAREIVNVIIGNCTADLAKAGETLTLSPPLSISDTKVVHWHRGSSYVVLSLAFDSGVLDVAFIGPRPLFDRVLNYFSKT